MRIAVTGATGLMGQAVVAAARDRSWTVGPAVSRSATTVDGLDVSSDDELGQLLGAGDPAVVVDFTVPAATVRYADVCREAGIPLVIGTTGFSETDRSRLQSAASEIPVLKATNFAKGIHVLRRIVREAVQTVPDYDIELTETHHNRKRDAPSGTARSILGDIEETLAGGAADPREFVYGREGLQPRTSGEIGVHVRRAGDVRGEHEVLLAGDDEVLTLTHRAESRRVFAAGALDAAAWLADREPGWYDFEEVLQT